MSILTDLGIAVCTLTYGKDSSFAGVNAATTITITPKGANNAKLALVWDATGDSFQSFDDSASADPGVVGTIDVPQTGQDGFLMNGQPFKDWYYEASVRSSILGQSDIVRTYRFQIPAGTTSLDVDRLPLQGQVILPPVVAPTVPVTSVNGRTGPVTIDASELDAIPADEKDAPGGVAGLTSGGLVKDSQLPSRLSAANIEQIDETASAALDTITDGRLSAPSLAATISTQITTPGTDAQKSVVDVARQQNGPTASFNRRPIFLSKWNSAIARAIGGGAAARLVLQADSIGRGEGATAPFNVYSWLYLLNDALSLQYGDAGLGVDPFIDVTTQDTRYTISAGWTRDPGIGAVSTGTAWTTSTAGATLTYASPTEALSSIRIWYRQRSGGGSFTTTVDGGTASAATSTDGTEDILFKDVALTGSGTHSIVITNVAATPLTIMAVEEMVNAGNGGIKVAKFAQSGARTANFIAAAQLKAQTVIGAADLTIIALETNDYANNITPVATYKSQMATLIQNAQLTGDVLLVATPATSGRRGPNGIAGDGDDVPLTTSPVLADYTTALYELAAQYGCALVDFQQAWGTWAQANARGYMTDDYHPSQRGYREYARTVLNVITPGLAPAVASTGRSNIWTRFQKFLRAAWFGDANTAGNKSRVWVGSYENLGAFPADPYLLATSVGNVYAAATALWQFRSNAQMQAGKGWTAENGNVPVLGLLDGFLRVKAYATASALPSPVSAAVAGSLAYVVGTGLVESNGTNWLTIGARTIVPGAPTT